jgi:hypothetical protein
MGYKKGNFFEGNNDYDRTGTMSVLVQCSTSVAQPLYGSGTGSLRTENNGSEKSESGTQLRTKQSGAIAHPGSSSVKYDKLFLKKINNLPPKIQ